MSDIVPPPRLTLGLVGKRVIDSRWRAGMERDLVLALDAVAEGVSAAARPRTAKLTLITGLADGADQIAGALFLASESHPVRRVLGAILPCPGVEFARNSPVRDRAAFDRAAQSCAFITVLRGRLPPPPPDGLNTDAARQVRRARGDAFAAQADALLQEADILVAIDDPDDEGEVGGTRHTLNRALSRRLPVILIHLGRAGVSLPRLGSAIERDEALRGECASLALARLAEAATATPRAKTEV